MVNFSCSQRWLNACYGVAVLVLAGGLLLTSTLAFAAKDGKRFKDWTVGCEKLEDKGESRCFIYQTIVDNEDEKPVFQIAIGYMPGIKDPTAILTLPLGVTLVEGIRIRIDDNEKVLRIPYDRCVLQGCIAGFKLNNEVLGLFKKGAKATVLVYNGEEQVQLPISLNGFTAGFKSLP